VAKPKHKPKPTNTVHFACFTCRKAFKQRGSSNWDPDLPARPFSCPVCKQPMVRLGRYFKAPPQRAARQWLKVELLCHYGERFELGNLGLGSKCRTLASTVAYLAGLSWSESDVRERLEQLRAAHRQGVGKPASRHNRRGRLGNG
jgi:hypothetical protein